MSGIPLPELIEQFNQSHEFKEMMAQIWPEDTLGVEYAESTLLSLTQNQYRTIVSSAQGLISKQQTAEQTVITENFPESLDFLQIKQIRVSNGYCDIYLYKGIGSMKSIGFSVKQEKNGSWQLSHFNYLKSYDSIPINLDELE